MLRRWESKIIKNSGKRIGAAWALFVLEMGILKKFLESATIHGLFYEQIVAGLGRLDSHSLSAYEKWFKIKKEEWIKIKKVEAAKFKVIPPPS